MRQPAIGWSLITAMTAAAPLSHAEMLARSVPPVCAEAAFTPDSSRDLGLRVCLTRAAAVFAVNEPLELSVSAARDVTIEVWLTDADGGMQRVAPGDPAGRPLRVPAGGVLRLPVNGSNSLRLGSSAGTYELRVVANAIAPLATRSLLTADDRLAGRDQREERRIVLRVVKAR